jgi:hypothetical protein
MFKSYHNTALIGNPRHSAPYFTDHMNEWYALAAEIAEYAGVRSN